MNAADRKRFTTSLELAPKHLAWFNSVSDEFASKWVFVLPKGSSFTFDSQAYRTLMSHRLFLDQPDHIVGTRCNCTRRPVLDPKCHHCITGCPKTAMGLGTHNAVNSVISDCAQSAGLQTKKEETGLFERNYNGELTEKEKRSRADLTIRGVSGPHRTLVLDVSITSVIPTNGDGTYTLQQAKTPQLAAEIRYATKMAKYNHAATTMGIKFEPIIIENSGRMHAKSLLVIESLLKNMSGYKDGALLKRYWMNRVSCTFQQNIARHIIDKLRKQNGQRFIQGFCENRANFAIDYEITANNAR
jgi:hypothetical protein